VQRFPFEVFPPDSGLAASIKFPLILIHELIKKASTKKAIKYQMSKQMSEMSP